MVNLNLLAAIAYVLLAITIFSIKLLDYKALASVGEFYISIIGIILIPCISSFEQRDNIKEVIYSRKTSYTRTILIRIIITMIFIFCVIGAIMILAKIQGCSFNFWEITFGTWISAVFLGTIGFTVANFCNSTSAAYLVGFGYYFIEYLTKGKYTKNLYLFSLTNGNFSTGKYWLLAITLIILTVNLILKEKIISSK